jgi:Tol biopolymer transport system component
MDADGSNVTQLTDTALGHEGEPNWSPDSKTIVYSGSRVDTQTIPFEIWAINADGTIRRRLTDSTFPFSARVPVWSPDGKRIAFHGEGGINVMNADGSDRKALTLANRNLDWQPIPGPRRGDYQNAAHFCKAERDFWGEDFAERYGGGANAFGKCVSSS